MLYIFVHSNVCLGPDEELRRVGNVGSTKIPFGIKLIELT